MLFLLTQNTLLENERLAFNMKRYNWVDDGHINTSTCYIVVYQVVQYMDAKAMVKLECYNP